MKSRKRSKQQVANVFLQFSETAQEFFLPDEQRKLAAHMVEVAASKRGWAPGKTWETTIEKNGQRFEGAVDNRRDGIYVLVGRAHELIHEDVPA